MKIAIHKSLGSYSKQWIEYCEENQVPFKIVNCYENNIIQQLEDCDALMWHHNHANPKDFLFAKQLLFSLEMSGKFVFPDWKTGWHFDDKLGQKYLLEALDIPMAPSYAFYSKIEAKEWLNNADLPLVFKLRGGAASRNVKLVKNKRTANKIINKAFGNGFRQFDPYDAIRENIRKFKKKEVSLKDILKAFAHIIFPIQLEQSRGREKGYVYFQKFIPNLEHDIRIQVINDKCYAMFRMIRENDFRASGSGNIDFDGSKVPKELIKLSFELAKKIDAQSIAFDFVPYNGSYVILEVSYAWGIAEGELEFGYWDKNLIWHSGQINPIGWMIEDVIQKVNEQNQKK